MKTNNIQIEDFEGKYFQYIHKRDDNEDSVIVCTGIKAFPVTKDYMLDFDNGDYCLLSKVLRYDVTKEQMTDEIQNKKNFYVVELQSPSDVWIFADAEKPFDPVYDDEFVEVTDDKGEVYKSPNINYIPNRRKSIQVTHMPRRISEFVKASEYSTSTTSEEETVVEVPESVSDEVKSLQSITTPTTYGNLSKPTPDVYTERPEVHFPYTHESTVSDKPNNPFDSLIRQCKKEDRDISFELNLSIPNKDFISILGDQYTDENVKDQIIDCIMEQLVNKEVLIQTMRTSLRDYYFNPTEDSPKESSSDFEE